MGRRRPWMLGGAISVVFFMILMYTNPHIRSQGWLAVWVIIIYCLLVASYSVINIPYGALTPELTRRLRRADLAECIPDELRRHRDIHRRRGSVHRRHVRQQGYSDAMVMGAAMGLVICVTALITYFMIKEPARAAEEASVQEGFLKTYRAALTNRPFVLVLVAYGCTYGSHGVLQTTLSRLLPVHLFGTMRRPRKFALAPLLRHGRLVFIPVWTQVSKRIGKKWAYNLRHGAVRDRPSACLLLRVDSGPDVHVRPHGSRGDRLFDQLRDAVRDHPRYGRAGVRADRHPAGRGVLRPVEPRQPARCRTSRFLINGWVLKWTGYVPNVEQAPMVKLGHPAAAGTDRRGPRRRRDRPRWPSIPSRAGTTKRRSCPE